MMKIFGVIALLAALLAIGLGLYIMFHQAGNKAIAQRNLERVKAETEALAAAPPSPARNAQLQQLNDQFLNFGGMNAEADQNLTTGLIILVGGVFVGFTGLALLAISLFRKSTMPS
jgi:hypothetical protein